MASTAATTQKMTSDLKRQAFVAEAVAARSEAIESGEGYAAEDVHRYLAARVRGEKAKRPEVRTWRKQPDRNEVGYSTDP